MGFSQQNAMKFNFSVQQVVAVKNDTMRKNAFFSKLMQNRDFDIQNEDFDMQNSFFFQKKQFFFSSWAGWEIISIFCKKFTPL